MISCKELGYPRAFYTHKTLGKTRVWAHLLEEFLWIDGRVRTKSNEQVSNLNGKIVECHDCVQKLSFAGDIEAMRNVGETARPLLSEFV